MFISEGGLDVKMLHLNQCTLDLQMQVTLHLVQVITTLLIHTTTSNTTPADMLPFGITAKVAYAPDLHTYGSGNASGAASAITTSEDNNTIYLGRSATEYRVDAAQSTDKNWCFIL